MKRYRIVDGMGIVSDYHLTYVAALAVRDEMEAVGYSAGKIIKVTDKGLARVRRPKKK